MDESDPGKAWMLSFQAGDDDAFRDLVEHYAGYVSAFFRRTGADADSAEDLAQEVFLRIHRARERYEPTARFSTWLYRIVHRIAINDGTRNRWRRRVSFANENTDEDERKGHPELSETPDTNPLHRLGLKEVRAEVRRAVETLPDSQRTALLLNRFQGMSYEEVGEVLGLKLPAVKSLLFRARENVKKALTPWLGEEVADET